MEAHLDISKTLALVGKKIIYNGFMKIRANLRT
jgi:hypothetical protein